MERENLLRLRTPEGDIVKCINNTCQNTIFEEKHDWLICPECGSEFEVDDEVEGKLRYLWREYPSAGKPRLNQR